MAKDEFFFSIGNINIKKKEALVSIYDSRGQTHYALLKIPNITKEIEEKLLADFEQYKSGVNSGLWKPKMGRLYPKYHLRVTFELIEMK